MPSRFVGLGGNLSGGDPERMIIAPRFSVAGKMVLNSFQQAASIFQAGVTAVRPGPAVKKHLRSAEGSLRAGEYEYRLKDFDNLFVLGAGKAAAGMAEAVEEIVGERITAGRINTIAGRGISLKIIEVAQASHPFPDGNGIRATENIIELADRAGEGDLVIGLISGGGSALLSAPAPGISLGDLRTVTALLLKSGAAIEEINIIRKHLSRVKGGQLAGRIFPATLLCLVISDVVGDRLGTIASGPAYPDSSTFRRALEVIDRYDLRDRVGGSVISRLEAGINGEIGETPSFKDRIFDRVRHLIVADNRMALEASAARARELGFRPLILSAPIAGEARSVARRLMARAKSLGHFRSAGKDPLCLLAGGEVTVRVRGEGHGGSNQEFVLAAARQIRGERGITVLSAGSDGIDGPTDAAGAVADGNTVARAEKLGLDGEDFLERNDSYRYFEKLGQLLITGPTGTNVMDLRVILIEGKCEVN